MSYLKFKEITITNFSDKTINNFYNQGYVFTRIKKGIMNQTRSLRINLNKFELSSENKRILKKTKHLQLQTIDLPYNKYNWTIGKLGKDFYTTKFGDGTFSANKIKELLTTKHNFNKLFKYIIFNEINSNIVKSENSLLFTKNFSIPSPSTQDNIIGYAICKETNELLHYSYPFYDLQTKINNLGMGMMLQAILWSKANHKKYIYLGSAQRSTDIYKLQFSGLEWFDGKTWQTDLKKLKNILK